MKKYSMAIFYFLSFCALIILFSYWSGFFYLSTPLVLFLSFIALFFLVKRFPIQLEIKIPRIIFLIALIAFFLCVYPVLLVHPFYPTGNDTLHTTTLRTLQVNKKIPKTYEPFAGISFTYLVGFHLLAKVFSDLMPFFPDYLVLWFLGGIFAFLQIILVYLFSFQLFKSKRTALFSSILFLGTKDIYQNMFFGLYPREAAACFFFAAFFLILKKNKLAYVFIPVIAMLHSAFFAMFGLFSGLFLVFKKKLFLLKYVPSIFLAIPAFYQSYLVLLSSHISSNAIGIGFNPLNRMVSLALWIGWIPLIVFIIGFIFYFFKKSFFKEKLFALSVFLSGIGFYFYMAIRDLTAKNSVVWLMVLGAVLFGSLALKEIKVKKKMIKYGSMLLIVLCIMSFFGSGYIQSRVYIDQDREAKFAFKFKEVDPGLKQTVIILKESKGRAKIAELSNKILYNALKGFFLPISGNLMHYSAQYIENEEKLPKNDSLIELDEGFMELLKRELSVKKIIEKKCSECLYDLNVEYAVIDPEYAGFDLNAKPLLEYRGLKLYKLN